jgi:hypothetical protein
MHFLALVLCLGSIWPLIKAWVENRQTSLCHALVWLWVAWAGWTTTIAFDLLDSSPGAEFVVQYIALCLTGCAAVAVFGARQPGASAWNFVVLGLLAINLLPLAEGTLAGFRVERSGLCLLAVAAPLAAGILNYLPTRLGAAALLLLAACGIVLASISTETDRPVWLGELRYAALVVIPATPWVAFALVRIRATAAKSEFDALWRSFRNRFGFVWGERLRQQFNSSAHHNGWPVVLHWAGLQGTAGSDCVQLPEAEMLHTLKALMKRFAARND